MKEKFILLTVLAVLSICLPAQGQPWSGIGTEGNPYLIEDANDMQAIGSDPNYWDAHFKLMNDIDLGKYTGTEFNIIGNDANAFTGVFDGGDNSISNFTYSDSTGLDNIGLFGCVDDLNAEIRDLTISNIDIDLSGISLNVGSFVGWLKDGTIRNSRALSVQVEGWSNVGGMIGENDNGTVLECYTTDNSQASLPENVVGSSVVGGLIGTNYGMISNCHTDASIEVFADLYSGGLVGMNHGILIGSHADGKTTVVGQIIGGLAGRNWGTISFCYATGQVEVYVTGLPGSSVGGLVGLNDGTISNCYAHGNVSGNTGVGGFVGTNNDGSIIHSYTVGIVSGDSEVGGLVGRENVEGFYQSCFWDSDINPTLTGIGNITDPNVIGKTTSELKQPSTFTNWDFIETWGIEDNQTYPFLKLTYPIGDLNYDKQVGLTDVAIMALHWLEDNNP